MLFFSSEKDLREFLEESISCAERHVRTCQEWEKKYPSGDSGAKAIKYQKELAEKWKKQYADRFGHPYGKKPTKKPKLTVIQGRCPGPYF